MFVLFGEGRILGRGFRRGVFSAFSLSVRVCSRSAASILGSDCLAPYSTGPGRTARLVLVATAGPSRHRRERRQRQAARALLAVERARRVLASHHGGGGWGPMAPQSSKSNHGSKSVARFTNWNCRVCNLQNNWGWRDRCRNCEAYPDPGARRPLGSTGGGSKGISNSANSFTNWGGGGRGGGGGTFAERQLQQQRQDEKKQKQQRELAEAKKRTEALREENRRLQRQLAAAEEKRDGDDMDDAEGPAPMSDEQRQSQIAQVKAGLPYLEARYGKESDEYLRANSELEVLQRASRDSKPYKTHRAYLERRLEKLQRQQEGDKGKVDDAEQQIEALQANLVELRESISERAKTISSTENELHELLRSAMGKDNDGDEEASPPTDVSAAWSSVVASASSLAGRPGVPTDWADQLRGLFSQLHTVVQAMEGAAASHEAASQSAHAEQMRQQQLEQQQLQAQLSQHQSALQAQGLPPQPHQPHHHQPHHPVAPQPIAIAQALMPAAPAPVESQVMAAGTSAEDMVARAMALTANSAAAPAEGGEPAQPPQHAPEPQPELALGEGGQQASAQAAAGNVELSDDEPPDTDDDDMEVQVRDGETVEQHSARVKKLLRERIQRARERKAERKEAGRASKCGKEGKDAKEGKGKTTVKKPSVKK